MGFYGLADLATDTMVAIGWSQLVGGPLMLDLASQESAFFIFLEGHASFIAGPPVVDLGVCARANPLYVVT